MRTPNIAILVIGFKEPEVLALTAPLYKAAGFSVFVHIDTALDMRDYISRMGDAADHCNFIQERYRIYWGGFAMIKATIALINAARSSDNFTHYALVSDDTFPVLPLNDLRSFLGSERQRIGARKLAQDDKFYARYEHFFLLDHPATAMRGRYIEKSYFDDDFVQAFERLKTRKEIGKAPIDIYYGSQWWCLTKSAVEQFLNRHESDAALRESFEFTSVPDEMYIQTVIGNLIGGTPRYPSPMMVDWMRDPKPYVFQTMNETLSFRGREHCFVRKVSSRDRQFLDEMVRFVCGDETSSGGQVTSG